jgi:uncharacterized membrane protein
MKKIQFNDPVAQRLYSSYLQRAERQLAVLSPTDREDALMEINSHIYESTAGISADRQANELLNVLEKLGEPEMYLKPLIGQKKLDEATRTFSPKAVYQAIKFNLKRGFIFPLFALLYLFLSAFVVLIVLKIIAPGKTGLFCQANEPFAFGFVSHSDGLTEVLGWWFLPMALATAAVFYLLITLLLRLTRN